MKSGKFNEDKQRIESTIKYRLDQIWIVAAIDNVAHYLESLLALQLRIFVTNF